MFGEPKNSPDAVSFETAFTIRDDLRKPINDAVRSEMHTGQLYPYYGANGQVDSINDYLMDCDAICLAEDCGAYGAGEHMVFTEMMMIALRIPLLFLKMKRVLIRKIESLS